MNALRPRNDFLSCFFSTNIYQSNEESCFFVSVEQRHQGMYYSRRRFSLTPLVMRLVWACLARDTPLRKTDRLQDTRNSSSSVFP